MQKYHVWDIEMCGINKKWGLGVWLGMWPMESGWGTRGGAKGRWDIHIQCTCTCTCNRVQKRSYTL